MKKGSWLILSAAVAGALPWAACGQGSAGGATGTGGRTTAPTSTSSTGGGSSCGALLAESACDDCISASCCPELQDCNVDPSCLDCFTGNAVDPTVCGTGATKTTLDAVTACAAKSCATPCAPTAPSCNPVTNAGCMDGSACDFAADPNGQATFSCYAPPPPNTAAICGTCDDKTTACQGGSTCLNAQCARFCCDQGDCGDGGVCSPTHAFGVGICVTAESLLDAGMRACNPPAVAPSMGKCVVLGDAGPDTGAPPGDAGSDGAGDSGAPPTDAGGSG